MSKKNLYTVIDNEDGQYMRTYLERRQAIDYISRMKNYGIEGSFSVHENVVTAIPNQRITIHGEHIGYQFNRKSFGLRRIKRSVRNIRNEDGKIVGTVQYMGRDIDVTLSLITLWRTFE